MSKLLGQNRSKRRIRWIGAGIVVLGVAAGCVIAVINHEDTTVTAKIVVSDVGTGDVTLDVATTGTVEPATERDLSFGVDGTVETIKVRAGTTVTAGQKLATVDKTDATTDVDDAEDTLDDAEDRLAAAETAAAKVTASATMCVTATSDHRGGGATSTAVAAATGDAPLSLERTAATACTTPGYPDTQNDQVLSAEQSVNRAEVSVAEAKIALAGATIKAPIAGTVVSVSGSVGDKVSSGKTFVTLADTYDMQVEADFPEADAGSLAVGQTTTITLADHDDTLDGTVVQVDPVGTSDGTLVRYGVVIAFGEAPSDLLVGQSAQVQVRVGEKKSVLRVPSTSVHDVSGGSGTVLVRHDGESKERTVTVGLQGDSYTEITDGLTAGEQVVRSW
ncbi:efflux RND transporter periplasmic adaptor subunit [Actinoplanes sp. NPDC051851]|uniref:efflux RND transporter periplasmic adaptor subunit n=1 Tax=Actinoplanes sp. NPDC051851 TaxID=3154753 RepID=UPI003412B990